MIIVNGYKVGDLVYNIIFPTEMGIVIGWYKSFGTNYPKIYWISGENKEKIGWAHKDIIEKVNFESVI